MAKHRRVRAYLPGQYDPELALHNLANLRKTRKDISPEANIGQFDDHTCSYLRCDVQESCNSTSFTCTTSENGKNIPTIQHRSRSLCWKLLAKRLRSTLLHGQTIRNRIDNPNLRKTSKKDISPKQMVSLMDHTCSYHRCDVSRVL